MWCNVPQNCHMVWKRLLSCAHSLARPVCVIWTLNCRGCKPLEAARFCCQLCTHVLRFSIVWVPVKDIRPYVIDL